jgi:hypothetical protein
MVQVSVVELVSVIKSPKRHLPRSAQDLFILLEIQFGLLLDLSFPIYVELISRV